MHAYFAAMSRYAVFRGRASRAEFWQFSLVYMIGAVIIVILDQSLVPPGRPGAGLLTGLYGLFHALPGTALLVRRLHDTDRTGWWVLINLTGIGTFVLLAFAMLRGTPTPNRFGQPPAWSHGAEDDERQRSGEPRQHANGAAEARYGEVMAMSSPEHRPHRNAYSSDPSREAMSSGHEPFAGRAEPRLSKPQARSNGFDPASTAPPMPDPASELVRPDLNHSRNVVADLGRLADLHAQGRLTNAEFAAMTKRIINE